MRSPTEEQVRAEVADWLDRHWDTDLTVREWWRALAAAGYAAPTLPVERGGRAWTPDLAAAAMATIAERGALGPPAGLGLMLAAPTLVAHGDTQQVQELLPRILDGQHGWCQLFSEPGAGSDLAGLQTRAVRDGDEWVVTGQKVWTSTAQHADYGMLLARTDPDQPKHRGITYFAFPMRQPGVEVRPLREMTGRAIFNEVFLDGARVPHANIVGAVNEGWLVANTTLMVERSGIGGGGGEAFSAAVPGTIAGHLDRRVGEFVGQRSAMGATRMGVAAVRTLVQLAQERGQNADPAVRQALARLYSRAEIGRLSILRAKSGGARTGGEGNLAKLLMADQVRLGREVGCLILGAHAMLAGDAAPAGGLVHEMIVSSPGPSIYGGTDQVQRNIVGERVLGLPKEPGPSRDTPFCQLLAND